MGLVLSGCAAQPSADEIVAQAEAENLRVLVVQDVLDREQERSHRESLNSIEEENAARRAENFTSALRWFGLGVMGGVVVLAIGGGIGLALFLVGRGASSAIRAMSIPMDASTRSFPLIPRYAGKGIFLLANPNDGEVMRLDTRYEADRLKVRSFAATQLGSGIAQEAAKAEDATGVGIIRPVVVEEELDDVPEGEV